MGDGSRGISLQGVQKNAGMIDERIPRTINEGD